MRIIVCPKNVGDAVAVVKWAAEHKQTGITARSGGHALFSSAEAVIDMREGFNYASMDEEATGVATIGMGQTLGQVNEQLDPCHVRLELSHTLDVVFCSPEELVVSPKRMVRAQMTLLKSPSSPRTEKSMLVPLRMNPASSLP